MAVSRWYLFDASEIALFNTEHISDVTRNRKIVLCDCKSNIYTNILLKIGKLELKQLFAAMAEWYGGLSDKTSSFLNEMIPL